VRAAGSPKEAVDLTLRSRPPAVLARLKRQAPANRMPARQRSAEADGHWASTRKHCHADRPEALHGSQRCPGCI